MPDGASGAGAKENESSGRVKGEAPPICRAKAARFVGEFRFARGVERDASASARSSFSSHSSALHGGGVVGGVDGVDGTDRGNGGNGSGGGSSISTSPRNCSKLSSSWTSRSARSTSSVVCKRVSGLERLLDRFAVGGAVGGAADAVGDCSAFANFWAAASEANVAFFMPEKLELQFDGTRTRHRRTPRHFSTNPPSSVA